MTRTSFSVDTTGSLVTEITDRVQAFAREAGHRGVVHVFVPHATCGVALMETGSGSEEDLAAAVERVLPRSEGYVHRHGPEGHGADHVLPVFVSPSISIPVEEAGLALGTWQRVVLVDPNRHNNRRDVVLTFLEV